MSISTLTLDSYWGATMPQVDVLKMDIQGAEGLALRGMRETILQSKKLKIFMEFWPYALIRCGTDPKELIDELQGYGFSIMIIDQDKVALRPLVDTREVLANEEEEASFDLFLER